jgi:hypothetical protein
MPSTMPQRVRTARSALVGSHGSRLRQIAIGNLLITLGKSLVPKVQCAIGFGKLSISMGKHWIVGTLGEAFEALGQTDIIRFFSHNGFREIATPFTSQADLTLPKRESNLFEAAALLSAVMQAPCGSVAYAARPAYAPPVSRALLR